MLFKNSEKVRRVVFYDVFVIDKSCLVNVNDDFAEFYYFLFMYLFAFIFLLIVSLSI